MEIEITTADINAANAYAKGGTAKSIAWHFATHRLRGVREAI